MEERIITLEQILLEVETHVVATPERVNSSKVPRRRGLDYTDDYEEESDNNQNENDDNQDDAQDEPEDTDYTQDSQDDSGDDEAESSDYIDDSGDDSQDEGDSSDYTQGDDDSSEDDTGNEDEDADNDDYTASDDDFGGDDESSDDNDSSDSGDDYSGDSSSSDDNSSPHGASEDEIKEKDTKVKNLLLLKQMQKLYLSLGYYSDKIDSEKIPNIVLSSIQSNVYNNFSKLQTLVHRYIVYYYSSMSYEYNLYVYNYILETIKINLELLSKVTNKDEVIY